MKKFLFIGKHILFIILFTGIYYLLSHQSIDHFGYSLTLLDSLYYSMITQTTIGYGDIVPLSNVAKIVCMCQMFTLAIIISFHI